MPIPPQLVLLLALLTVAPACAQKQKAAKPPEPSPALATDGLAGQPVIVMPLTKLEQDARIPGATGLEARTRTLRWVDSLLGDLLQERAPEVNWVLGPALRRTAERAGGIIPSPDQMGQSVMRSAYKDVPDPLRSYLRQLVAMVGGGRFALIPAALYATAGPGDSLTVQLSAVLTDGRLGKVLWRTLAVGRGATMAEAFRAAFDNIIPPDTPPPSR
jgi:hypothetical protein